MQSTIAGLYRKAVEAQWNAETLPWETPVDPGSPWMPARLFPLSGSEVDRRLDEAGRERAPLAF